MKEKIFHQIKLSIIFTLLICLGILLAPAEMKAQGSEYRMFWVDTFNTNLNNHADILAVVNNAKLAKANALLAQVRRRGDAWYLNSLEPVPDTVTFPAGFDPLQDLIATAHAEGIEVHAFVIMSAIWNRNPTVAGGLPASANHVFRQHSGFNQATGQIVPGPNNWLTRTLLPDNAANGITFQGHRFGADFWLDFGHPDAAAYTVNVLTHLVTNYDIDGLHLDRIRYPEFTATGQTPANGTSIGYNTTSVERFQIRNDIPVGSPPPAQNNAAWSQWRRDQVSNLVRRVYLNAIAIKPNIKVSAALIAFGGGPVTEAQWNSAEAYWRVYQDWRAWTQEGILDIAIPMNYKRDHVPAQLAQFDSWNEWTKNHQYNRSAMIGLGSFLNSLEGNLPQIRRSRTPSTNGGNTVRGVAFFSMANTNVAVPANPLSIPPGQNTPLRPFSEFASSVTTGKSVDGTVFYEAQPSGYTPVFAQAASIPVLSWKVAPTKGHLMGFARRADTSTLDTAIVTIQNLADNSTRTTATDGGGFYGGVDLSSGQYLVKAVLRNDTVYSCVATVSNGAVTTADLQPETTAPTTTALLNPSAPNGTNGWYTSDVTVNFSASDNCTGVAATEYSLDGGNTWIPFTGSFVISNEGTTTVSYRSTDRAGNVETAQTLTIMLDKTAPTISLSASPNRIFPPNGKPVNITLTGSGGDVVSGLASVSYVVTDEYGTPLSIPTRSLTGNSANWTDSLIVEARRNGDDLDGRLYRVVATVRDAAGNTSIATADIIVPHDQRGN